jgi:hypothetical protein
MTIIKDSSESGMMMASLRSGGVINDARRRAETRIYASQRIAKRGDPDARRRAERRIHASQRIAKRGNSEVRVTRAKRGGFHHPLPGLQKG